MTEYTFEVSVSLFHSARAHFYSLFLMNTIAELEIAPDVKEM